MYEFSKDSYRNLLSTLRNHGYKFQLLTDWFDGFEPNTPSVFMRHDIDVNLPLAQELAQLEYNEGIRSVYFVCLRSPFYNPLDYNNAKIIQEIHKLHHVVATHIVLPPAVNTAKVIERDVELLAENFPFINTDLISIHSPIDLNYIKAFMHVPGIAKVYGPILQGELSYSSDSGCTWRSGFPCDLEVFIKRFPLHILTHPVWWLQEGATPLEKLQNLLSTRALLSTKEYRAFLPKLSSDFALATT